MEEEQDTMSFTKISVAGGDYYLFTTRTECDTLHLTLTDCLHFWRGTVSKKETTKCRDLLPLRTSCSEDRKFCYQLTNINDTNILFKWKEENTAENIKMTLGSATLTRADDVQCVTQEIFDQCISVMTSVNCEIAAAKREKDILLHQNTDTLQRFNKLVDDKQLLEQELYSKFLLVLNSKKTEISRLHDKLKDLESRVSPSADVDSEMETSPSSDSIYDQETQIETDPKATTTTTTTTTATTAEFSDESSEEFDISITSRQILNSYHEERKRAKVLDLVKNKTRSLSSSSSAAAAAAAAKTKAHSPPRKRFLKKDNESSRLVPDTLPMDHLLDQL